MIENDMLGKVLHTKGKFIYYKTKGFSNNNNLLDKLEFTDFMWHLRAFLFRFEVWHKFCYHCACFLRSYVTNFFWNFKERVNCFIMWAPPLNVLLCVSLSVRLSLHLSHVRHRENSLSVPPPFYKSLTYILHIDYITYTMLYIYYILYNILYFVRPPPLTIHS